MLNMDIVLNLLNDMTYELNEQQRTQLFAVLWHWKHVLFKEHNMPITDELLNIFNKPYYEPQERG